MSVRRAALPLFLAGVVGSAQAQVPAARPLATPIRVRDVGAGQSGRMLRTALSSPHTAIAADSGIVALRRDTAYATTVVVLAPQATVASQVHGDVIVVGGDLFLHPGAIVDGRAIAIGGGVYSSTLAVVRNGQFSFRDNTFVTAQVGDTLVLGYRALGGQRPETVYLPGVGGFAVPSYDRVNGLSVPWGPAFAFDTARIVMEPAVTYRSHLGEFDPSVALRGNLGRRNVLSVAAGRGTFTNDAWIRPDPLNSVAAFVRGIDARNYYRADRGELRLGRLWEGKALELEPFLGALTEVARPVGPALDAGSVPYSMFARGNPLGMRRPNPAVLRGRISSGLAGARLRWADGGVAAELVGAVETPFQAPGGGRFAQTTLDGQVAFPAFLNHRFEFFTHVVLTAGDTAPPQRFAYLGGAGTLLTLDLLELGGDQLLFTESRYTIPLTRPVIPFLGAPMITLRHLSGTAGVARLPGYVHNLGVRLTISAFRLDYLIDPETRRSDLDLTLAVFR